MNNKYKPLARELLIYIPLIALYMFAFYGCSKLAKPDRYYQNKLEEKVNAR